MIQRQEEFKQNFGKNVMDVIGGYPWQPNLLCRDPKAKRQRTRLAHQVAGNKRATGAADPI